MSWNFLAHLGLPHKRVRMNHSFRKDNPVQGKGPFCGLRSKKKTGQSPVLYHSCQQAEQPRTIEGQQEDFVCPPPCLLKKYTNNSRSGTRRAVAQRASNGTQKKLLLSCLSHARFKLPSGERSVDYGVHVNAKDASTDFSRRNIYLCRFQLREVV